MGKKTGMEVSIAASHAVMLADADCIAAYPITPQTHIVEHLSELVADGELDAEYIPVESEHSAMSVCAGCSAVGARTFTATAAQGLVLMQEILHIVSAMRLPVVMTVVNRALSSPLSIWNDHSDIMGARDVGWIQIFCENGQEVFDNVICAFRIGEDPRVLLPVIINLDGFSVSHMVEPIELMDRETVDKFLPKYQPKFRLHPDRPITMGAFAMPEIFTETKMAHEVAIRDALPVVEEIWEAWAKITGRKYRPVEQYRTEGAKVLFVGQGGVCEVASHTVDELREEGEPVGLVKLRLWRPFPFAEVRAALRDAEMIIVLDRALSVGGVGGPLFSELAAVLYQEPRRPVFVDHIIGLGGRDIPPATLRDIYERSRKGESKKERQEFHLTQVRG